MPNTQAGLQQAGFYTNIVRGQHLIEASLVGLWNVDVLARFEAEVERAVQVLSLSGTPPGNALLLLDARNHGVQPSVVVEGFQEMACKLIGKVKRTAAIVDSTLQALQAKRVTGTLHYRVFTSDDAARAWLTGGL